MSKTPEPPSAERSTTDSYARGKSLRNDVPRSSHRDWQPAADRPDPVAMLEATSEDRVPELVPIRHARMMPSPFTFFRGSAAAMAYDLASTPTSGIRVQLCGDCHLLNFGGFATPERNLLFDVMDFDETLAGPWEWDVKRLAASVVVAGRSINLSKRNTEEAALAAVRSYRQRLYEFAQMRALEVWYARIDARTWVELARTPEARKHREEDIAKARTHTVEHVFPRMTEVVDGHRRIIDRPPLIYHQPEGDRFEREVRMLLLRYRDTLQEDRRLLLDRYRTLDVAMKVVGVGSVGTRCAVVLLLAGDDDPLLLQFKEAGASVLEPYAGKSKHGNHGHRVVTGQRLMQSASDIFLGWTGDEDGRSFYFRQLRDMKGSIRLESMVASDLSDYAGLCGWALARAHARSSGEAAAISGYLGKGDSFDQAVAEFAAVYADQTERDHAAMLAAVRSGRLPVHVEAPA